MPKIVSPSKDHIPQKKQQNQQADPESIYLGPVQITDEDNEWNKRALRIAAQKLQVTPLAIS
jgi:hypothetical protein